MLKQHLLASALLIGLASPAFADYSAGYNAYVNGNFPVAKTEFESAARTGDARAQYMLGRLYAEGRGVPQDFVQAHAWYNVAAANGYTPAETARDSLAARMTPTQISLAQSRAVALQPGIGNSGSAPISAGYSVRSIQQLLNAKGYDAGPADGVMGLRTRTAIQAYQRVSGLPVTGQPSIALYNHLTGSAGAALPAQPQPQPIASAYSLRDLQTLLNQRGYDAGPADGVMGNRTRMAISAYQADNGLPVTGQASVSLYNHIAANPGNAQTTIVTAVDPQLVTAIQTELRRRGYDVPAINGRVDPATVAAIKTYQSDAGMPVNGLLTGSLLASLQSDTATSAGASTAMITDIQSELRRRGYSVSSITGRLDTSTIAAIRSYQSDAGMTVTGQPSAMLLASLQAGQGGPDVGDRLLIQQIQAELNARGYAIGTPDGVLGPRTRDAIRTFQSDAGLPITGQPSQTLLASLQNAGGPQAAVNSDVVLQLEQELSRKGYPVGPVDGVLDSQTIGAIRQYQTDAHLAVTGDVSNALLINVRTSNVYARPTTQGIVRDITDQIFDQLQGQIGQ